MGDPATLLLLEARRTLGWGQRQLAEHLGCSERTIQRWDARGSTPMPNQLARLAGLVYPQDPELASRIAKAADTTLDQLGLLPAKSAPSGPSLAHMADSITCAAADAVSMLPDAMRPALLAAFERARDMGVSVADVASALSARVGSAKKR
jgi:transcriptional regulator with XRE-family HTH domain